jgi:GT2 family glycosyltransferase
MTQTQTSLPTRLRHPGHHVTAVLVAHDGALWLPDVLAALAEQTRPADRMVAVDTSSADDSASLVAAAWDAANVLALAREASFGEAVQAGLDMPAPDGNEPNEGVGVDDGAGVVEWVWLLHDDCAPEPDALDELLTRVTHSPSVWLVGPKVRDWSGTRLLEAGLTIDASGHIDSGVDAIEIDQGQRDDVDEVLAVSCAGALIRRDVWHRLGGLEAAWSEYADDIDLGWRVNAAGGRVVVATRAAVRHARAGLAGLRSPDVIRGAGRSARRRNGMQVVLSNTAPYLVPLLLLRYLIGGAGRALGLLFIDRDPRRAAAEVGAVGAVLAHPGTIRSRRRARSATREVGHHDLRRLLPSGSRRWRTSPLRASGAGASGGGAGRAGVLAQQGGRVAETGPVSDDVESMVTDDGALGRLLRRPGVVLAVAMTLLALIADRHLFASVVHGGRLLPAPGGSSDLWSTYFASWHPSGVGSTTPAPPYLAVLATLATVAFGKPWLVVDVIMLGAVPLAALSAYAALRPITTSARTRLWLAVVYALLPAVTGAVAGGRIDIAAAAILLPQLIRAGVAAVGSSDLRTGLRRGAGAGLLLGVGAAFMPLLWIVAVVAFVGGIGLAALHQRSVEQLVPRLPCAALVCVVALLVLVPWTWHVAAHPSLLLTGLGLPEFFRSTSPPSGVSLALLHAGGPAQPPVWIGIPIVAAALLGLARRRGALAARLGALLLVGGVAAAVAMTRATGVTDGVPASRHWPGGMLLVAGTGALIACAVAASAARPVLRRQSFGWRQPAAVVLVAAALVTTAITAVGWAIRGADTPLTAREPAVLPLFVQSELAYGAGSPRAVVLDSAGPVVSYALIRRPRGPVLGDADTAPPNGTAAAAALSAAIRDLSAGRPDAGAELAPFAIGYVATGHRDAARLGPALGREPTLTAVPTPHAMVWRSTLPTGEVRVLGSGPATAALAGHVVAAPAARVVPAQPGSADATIEAGPAGRIVVLAEPADSHWHATLDGVRLASRTAFGWAQAFELPTTGGRLQIGYVDSTRTSWLWAELAVVVLVVLAALPARRPDYPDPLA